jgi:poly-gamma-glutamate system protein
MYPPLEHRALVLAALGAVVVWLGVDLGRRLPADPGQDAKVQAARIMQEGISTLRAERMRRGLAWDDALDPNHTGLIGRDYSDLTTTLGSLPAKRTATNPNLAGLVVELLDAAGVRRGEAIAVNFSGSFPALNLAVLAAARALDLRPAIISSVGASSYGANEPDWTWLEVERILAESGVTRHRSAWAALGGIIDERGGLDGTGIDLGRAAIQRNGVPLLDEGGRATVARDVLRRMSFYREACGGRPRAFVNVGGSLAALGAVSDAQVFPAGLIRDPVRSSDPRRGLVARMAEEQIPVIHLLDVRHLAARYGLPYDPVPLPGIPSGAVMRPRRHGRALAAAGLGAMAVMLVALHRHRRKLRQKHEQSGQSQPLMTATPF